MQYAAAREVTVLERLRSWLAQPSGHHDMPPLPPVHITPDYERRNIDARIRGSEARLNTLLAEAGLDHLRLRGRTTNHAE